MIRKLSLYLICFLLFVAGIVISFFAWREWNSAAVIIEWSTSTELDTAGFNVYRSVEGSDNEMKINQDLIPAATDPLVGGDYKFEDRSVEPGLAYAYHLEEIEIDGGVRRYGPIIIKAARGGFLELVIAGIMFVLSAVCLVVGYRSQKEAKVNKCL